MNTNENSCGFFNCLNEEQKQKVNEKVQQILSDRNNNEDHITLQELREKVAKGMYNLLNG